MAEDKIAEDKDNKEKIAVVLVRGMINTSREVRDTLKMLRLKRKNHCVVLKKNPSILGMVMKVKDLVTWGEVDDETVEAMKKRMREGVARLQPPRGGFERKGIKFQFKVGGALGYRGEKINDLIKRMV